MKKKLLLTLFLSILSINTYADESNFNQTIVRIINQINAINPLIEEARAQQSKNPRIEFHLDSFVGSDNQTHNGLSQDLAAIKQSLIAYLNKPSIEPRKITPLALDYVDAAGVRHG